MQKRFPAIIVGYQVVDRASNKTIKTGKFHLDNDQERRAFAERSNQAIMDGYEVRTHMKEDRRQFAALQGLKTAVPA